MQWLMQLLKPNRKPIPLDQAFFDTHRDDPELGQVNVFAPDAVALVSKVRQMMEIAPEPECTVVATPPLPEAHLRRLLRLSAPNIRPLAVKDVTIIHKTIPHSNGGTVAYDMVVLSV